MSIKALAPFSLMPLFDTHQCFREPEAKKHNASSYLENRPCIAEYLGGHKDLIDVYKDYESAARYLDSHYDTPTTFNNYRTQVERLLLWSWNVSGKSFRELTRSDIESYLDFCREPDPQWVGTAITTRFEYRDGLYEANPDWRPFVYRAKKAEVKAAQEANLELKPTAFKMAESSIKQAYGALNSLFTYCTTDRVMEHNPCALIKRDMKRSKERQLKLPATKALTKLQWDFLLETAELNATVNPVSGERALFCIVMMFGCYMRVSDLAGNGVWLPKMGSFVYDREAWWYHTVGKGNVQARISVKPDCIKSLVRYRRYRGLPDYPSRDEQTALLVTQFGRDGVKARQIRKDVQTVLDLTVERMKQENFKDYEITELRAASLHWLRHTGATFDAPHRNPKNLQADLRHKSLSTTQDLYYHTLDDERSAEMQKLSLRR